MRSFSARLVAGVIAAGAVGLTLSTGVAAAAPADKPVLATDCGDEVLGALGQPVALDSDAVASAVSQAEAEAKKDNSLLGLGRLVDGLTGNSIALPEESFLVGEVSKAEEPIAQPAIVAAIMTELEPSFAEQDGKPAELDKLRATFEQALQEAVPASCTIAVQLKAAPKPEQPDQPQQPPTDGDSGQGDQPPQTEEPKQPEKPSAPQHPSTPAQPPAATPPVQVSGPPVAPDAPSLPPSLTPDAPPFNPDAPPLFGSPLLDSKGVPGVPSGQNAPQNSAVAPLGHATTLAEPSTSDDRDSIGFAMLAGVLAASAVTAGLVRATARRGAR